MKALGRRAFAAASWNLALILLLALDPVTISCTGFFRPYKDHPYVSGLCEHWSTLYSIRLVPIVLPVDCSEGTRCQP